MPRLNLNDFYGSQNKQRLFPSTAAFLKLWSADHMWSSGSALMVLLD